MPGIARGSSGRQSLRHLSLGSSHFDSITRRVAPVDLNLERVEIHVVSSHRSSNETALASIHSPISSIQNPQSLPPWNELAAQLDLARIDEGRHGAKIPHFARSVLQAHLGQTSSWPRIGRVTVAAWNVLDAAMHLVMPFPTTVPPRIQLLSYDRAVLSSLTLNINYCA